MMGMKIPKMHVIHKAGICPRDEKTGCEEGKTDDLVKQHYMLCGSLCTTGDVLVRDVELAALADVPGEQFHQFLRICG